jgi:anaerobic selenocysteine-containing dehydrogenase
VEIKRRDFLKLVGGVTGAVAIGGLGLDHIIAVPDEMVEKAKNGPGIETWKNTICGLCPGGCGIRVRFVDGVPVHIKGNPFYPVNQGGMCPLGRGALEQLFNPDRMQAPMKRIGLPGAGRWEPITWDEALQTIADKLVELRSEGKSHEVAFLGYNERGLMKEHVSRFMQAYGSPNYYQFSSLQNDSVPFMLMQGHSQIPAYDFLNARFVLSFGANILEEGYSPVHFTKLYGRLRESGGERRTRFIHVDSRMSITAANADRWIPIRPGTYGALALGIAYVLIREELYDLDFVDAHAFGFEDWTDRFGQQHLGFKSMVLGNYYPERVSDITGVPSETILEIARDLGNTQPAFVLGNQGTVDNTNGTLAQMAVYSLNALLGNFEKEGGIFFTDEPPLAALPPVEQDAAAKKANLQIPIGRSKDTAFPLTAFSMESLAKNILADQPYPISLSFLYKGNPLFQALNHHDFAEALKKIPLVVSFDSFIDETSEYADLILPDHTFLEKWDESSNIPSVGFTHAGIQQPVVKPFYDTRHTGDVLIDLATRIGGTVASSFPFDSYERGVKNRAESIYKSGEGAIAAEGVKRSWLEYLQQRGWHIGRYDSFEEFWELLLENGGWWNPIRKKKNWRDVFQTPSGRFEFYSQTLKETIDGLVDKIGGGGSPQNLELVLNSLGITARGDTIFLPHHESVPYDEDMPLHLTTFQLLTNRDGHSANLPMMQEMFGYTMRHYWRSWVEINTETAAEYGISDGDWVWIESTIGSIRVQAKVHPGIMPAVVSVPFGLGHTSYGRYARGHGVNPNSIIKNLYDLINGKRALQGTKVKISVVA